MASHNCLPLACSIGRSHGASNQATTAQAFGKVEASQSRCLLPGVSAAGDSCHRAPRTWHLAFGRSGAMGWHVSMHRARRLLPHLARRLEPRTCRPGPQPGRFSFEPAPGRRPPGPRFPPYLPTRRVGFDPLAALTGGPNYGIRVDSVCFGRIRPRLPRLPRLPAARAQIL